MKFFVSIIVPDNRFTTFTEATDYVDSILQQIPTAIVEVTNGKQE
jgi:hypothetical protein